MGNVNSSTSSIFSKIFQKEELDDIDFCIIFLRRNTTYFYYKEFSPTGQSVDKHSSST